MYVEKDREVCSVYHSITPIYETQKWGNFSEILNASFLTLQERSVLAEAVTKRNSSAAPIFSLLDLSK